MSIPIPNLDDRSFEDLMKEARALIPQYNRDWTNHNPSDPGITLLELFSWLGEMVIYRTNQVPDESYINFLKLIAGVPQRAELEKLLNGPFLFNWNTIEKNDFAEFRAFLKDDFDMDWATKTTIIKKTDKTLIVVEEKGKNRVELILGEKEDKANLIINGCRTRYLHVDKINSDLDIYNVPDLDIEYRKLLDLLREIEDGNKKSVIEIKGASVGYMESGYRAVTSMDFENKALDCMTKLQSGLEGRAVCMNNRDLEYSTVDINKLGHVSIIIIPAWMENSRYCEEYLFCFDEIPAAESDIFKSYIRKNYDANWVKDAQIKKTDENNINLSAGNHSLRLSLNKEKTKAVLTIDDVMADKFNVKMESNKPDIYSGSKDKPKPSPLLKEEVKGYLEAKKLITTRVHVVSPFYNNIFLKVWIALKKNKNEAQVIQEAANRINEYFHPVTGGPDGTGWPLGRNVYRSELYHLLEEIADIDHIAELWINGDAEAASADIEKHQLIALPELTVEKAPYE
ncbi:MAG: baseplate J/gp47 family protein [Candidatus Methanoperedens sp.]|nr:baseplate J/gp47 family protein [Candidatus Methanoperedens sp.]MCZ7403741.1 baseplate J/gp47 family protein [Candidatus Methanoperedens sp.]